MAAEVARGGAVLGRYGRVEKWVGRQAFRILNALPWFFSRECGVECVRLCPCAVDKAAQQVRAVGFGQGRGEAEFCLSVQ